MTTFKVDLVGDDKLSALFARASSRGMVNKLSQATFMTANAVLNESKEIVPVDNGILKDSGKVEKPKQTPNGVEVAITYGGKARAYALIVHEDPSAQHKDGKTYHYLKIPVDAARSTFVVNIKRLFATYLRQG